MTADKLRLAADLIRHDLAFGQEKAPPEFLGAVADWLEFAATYSVALPVGARMTASVMASAYIGDDA